MTTQRDAFSSPADLAARCNGSPNSGTLLPLGLAIGLFCALSLAAAITSRAFMEADACTHYIYARWALAEPHLLTNVWGRPFCTALYALPAVLAGRMGVRVTSMLLAVGTGLVAWRIAKGQGYHRPALSLIFVLAQPLVFLHSFSELTELPFTFLLALAFWAYQRKNWPALAVLAGLLPTSRPEGFGFLIMAAAALSLHRARWLPLLLAPLALWSIAGWGLVDRSQPWLSGILMWIPNHWPYAATSVYEPGPLLFFQRSHDGTINFSFPANLPAIVSPFIFPAFLLGLGLSFMSRPREASDNRPFLSRIPFFANHHTRCQWLIALIPLMILAGHSYLYWRGRMSSSGELRYMLVAAPFWGLVSAKGWEWVFDRCRLRGVFLWAGLAALAPIYANVMWRCIPFKYSADWVRAEEVAQWYRTAPLVTDYPRLMAAHIGIQYFGDVNMSDRFRAVEWHRKNVVSPPDGTILIWDPMYGVYNSDPQRSIPFEEIEKAGWVLRRTFSRQSRSLGDSAMARMAEQITKDEVGEWRLYVSPRDIHGRPSAAGEPPGR